MVAIEVGFKQEKEDDDPEPLRMEHFYFPLGLWIVGLLLSTIFLLAEIIHSRTRKSQTKVATVTQSTAESENLGEMGLNKWKAVRLADTEAAELDLAEENIEDIEDTKV